MNGLFRTGLSGGQWQLLILYISLVCPAEVILLDESMSEINPEKQIQVFEALADWPGRQRKVIIMVGHGITDKIPNHKTIKKLKMVQNSDNTQLVPY